MCVRAELILNLLVTRPLCPTISTAHYSIQHEVQSQGNSSKLEETDLSNMNFKLATTIRYAINTLVGADRESPSGIQY